MNDFNRQTATLIQALRIRVLSSQAELGSAFLHAVAPTEVGTGSASAEIDGQPFDLTISADADGGAEAAPSPDGVVLTVRYLDGASLKNLKAQLNALVGSPAVPIAAAMLRNEGESEFKISCCSCGQKLWVRDQDEGKRGRCPNCRKAFTLPSQESYLRNALQLSDAAPIRKGTMGDESDCRHVLSELATHIMTHAPSRSRDQGDEDIEIIRLVPEVPPTETDLVRPIEDD